MQLDQRLLEVLVCPCGDDTGVEFKERRKIVRCLACARTYPVVDGIPVMILEEATEPKRARK